MRTHLRKAALSALLLSLAGLAVGCAPATRGAPGEKSLAAARLAPSADRGWVVYRRVCASCHGQDGDGRGPAAGVLELEPRDFRPAVYRYRSTPTGSLPRDEDLARTIRLGLGGTEMPAWGQLLSEQQISDVVATIKRFSRRFGEEEIDASIQIPAPVPYSAASVQRGAAAYKKVQCGKCHGARGRGDGWASEKELRDDRGRVLRARDFTEGVYRSGSSRRDLYRVFYTGLDGTPMPGYEQSLAPTEIYDLINYLLSLERRSGLWYWLSSRPTWDEPSRRRIRR